MLEVIFAMSRIRKEKEKDVLFMYRKWVKEAMLQGLGHLLSVTPKGFAVGIYVVE